MHGPATDWGEDKSSKKKQKLGVAMFLVYLAVYSIFVGIGVFNYELMGKIVLFGQNLAVVYGMGLIVLAIILGLIYNGLCTKYEDAVIEEDEA